MPMPIMTINDLFRIIIECAGEEDGLDVSSALLDTEFSDLGYDSLALMETAARIDLDYGVVIADDRIADLRTPRALLDLVNGALAAAS